MFCAAEVLTVRELTFSSHGAVHGASKEFVKSGQPTAVYARFAAQGGRGPGQFRDMAQVFVLSVR
jgi:hypothetical protein